MKITPTQNHGKPCWRVNVQTPGLRKRLFFSSREEAVAFAQAAGGTIKFAQPSPSATEEAAQQPATQPDDLQRSGSNWTFFE